MATDTSSAAASAPGVLSDRTLAFAATPCFRVDVREHERPRIPGEAVQGHIRISRRLLVLSTATATNSSGGGGGSSKGYHAIDVSLMAEAKIRASVQMPQGNVVPTFEKIVLWKTPAQSLLSLANDNLKDDELGLVSVPFSIQLPPTVPALSTSPFHKDSKTASSEVIQVAPLPTCSLPPGLQIAVSVVVAARRTSSIVKRPRKDTVKVPILLHRKPNAKLLRWLPPTVDSTSHELRFDGRFWTSSTTIVTLKQTLFDRRRLWVTITFLNIARSNGAAESERLPFLLEVLYQSKRQPGRTPSNSTGTTHHHQPPSNMVDRTALPILPLPSAVTKKHLEPTFFVGQRVQFTLDDGTTSDFRHDELEIEWDPFHLEPGAYLTSTGTSSSSGAHGFAPRDRVQVRADAGSSGLQLFEGHGWTLPEWKSITQIKALRKSLDRGSALTHTAPDREAAAPDDDDVTALDEGDAEGDHRTEESTRSNTTRSLSHHTSNALSTLRKAILPAQDEDTVGYWISRAAVSGTFRAPHALPSFEFNFGPALQGKNKAKQSSSSDPAGGTVGGGFDSGSHERGQLALRYEIGIRWTVPESVQPGLDTPRAGNINTGSTSSVGSGSASSSKRKNVVTYKTFERGLVPWLSSSTGSYPDDDGDEDADEPTRRRQRLSTQLSSSSDSPSLQAGGLTRAQILRSAKAKCKAAKLGRAEPNLTPAEAEALEEEAESERGAGRWSGRRGGAAASGGEAEQQEEEEEGEEELDTLDDARRRRLRERNALLFNLPPGYFAPQAEFEQAPVVASVEGGGGAIAQEGKGESALEHNHPVKS